MPGFKAMDMALDRAASRLTPLIQGRAVDVGWPEESARRLRMVRTQYGTLSLDYDGPREEAEDLEYGTTTKPPSPVMTFVQGHHGKRLIRNTTLDSMDEIHDRLQRMFS
jgi:hypothetical protein